MKYKIFLRSRRIKSIKREVEKIYKKSIGNNRSVEKKKLSFKTRG